MNLDFFSKLLPPQRVISSPELQQSLARRQAEKIAELRANGFHALARWFSENPTAVVSLL